MVINHNEFILYIGKLTSHQSAKGSHDVAPNSASEGLDCFVKTTPVIKPVKEISATDL